MNFIRRIHKVTKEELKLAEVPYLVERCCSSSCCHFLNLYNLKEKQFHNSGLPTDFREHLLYMAPSGWGKSVIYRIFLEEEYGLLSGVGIPTDVQDTYSTEAWMGTVQSTNKDTGEVRMSAGVFERYAQGIIAADEYAKLAVLMEGRWLNVVEMGLGKMLLGRGD